MADGSMAVMAQTPDSGHPQCQLKSDGDRVSLSALLNSHIHFPFHLLRLDDEMLMYCFFQLFISITNIYFIIYRCTHNLLIDSVDCGIINIY